jgi:hypothetical protein
MMCRCGASRSSSRQPSSRPAAVRLRVAQSIFYAVTEICKGKPPSYHPGKEAVAGVRSAKYRVRPRP